MICYIFFRIREDAFQSQIKVWSIDASEEKDTADTIEAHMARWIPNAQLLAYYMGSMEEFLPYSVLTAKTMFPIVELEVFEAIRERLVEFPPSSVVTG